MNIGRSPLGIENAIYGLDAGAADIKNSLDRDVLRLLGMAICATSPSGSVDEDALALRAFCNFRNGDFHNTANFHIA